MNDLKNYILIGILLLNCQFSIAQKEDFIWILGGSSTNIDDLDGFSYGNTIINFNESPPNIKYDNQITLDMQGTNSAISNSEGELRLYSNGISVHNSNHQAINNAEYLYDNDYINSWIVEDFPSEGQDWIIGLPIIQSTLILPQPGNPEEYLIVYGIVESASNFLISSQLVYTRIDMTDSGSVVSKNNVVFKDSFNIGQINACRHANGRDWWILLHNLENTEQHIFIVDPSGIKHTNSLPIEGRLPLNSSTSQVYFSFQGNKYVVAETQGFQAENIVIYLFDFDRCSGLTVPIGIDTLKQFRVRSNVSFSPSGQFLYLSNHKELFQYDIWKEDWKASRQLVGEYDGYLFKVNEFDPGTPTEIGNMAHGPDGKVYSVPSSSNRFLHTIEYPDELGVDCRLIQRNIMLPTSNHVGIPNFPHFRLGPVDGSLCDTLGINNYPSARFRYEQDSSNHLKIRFTDISYYRPESWDWDFDDGSFFVGQKPYYHEFPENGTYDVCLTVSNENGIDEYCERLFLGVSSIELQSTPVEVSLFPNPIVDYAIFTIENYLPESGELTIYTPEGKNVCSQAVSHGWNNLDLSELLQGIYFYQFKDAGTVLKSGTFVRL